MTSSFIVVAKVGPVPKVCVNAKEEILLRGRSPNGMWKRKRDRGVWMQAGKICGPQDKRGCIESKKVVLN